jgi:hypothetical protein
MHSTQRILRPIKLPLRYVASVGLIAALAPLASLACSAKGLSSESTSNAGQPLANLAEQANVKIADLTDDQANQVCASLNEVFPWYKGKRLDSQEVALGCFTGAGDVSVAPTVLDGAPFDGRTVAWLMLTPLNKCVANLRHAPCQATVASLQACVQYWLANPETNDSPSYSDIMTGCAAFEGAANCDETVFQTHIDVSNRDGYNQFALPVVTGNVCGELADDRPDGG